MKVLLFSIVTNFNAYFKNIIFNLVICLSLIHSSLLLADECSLSTDSKMLMTNHSKLIKEKLNAKTGRYSALLDNGDSVLAHFDTCGLGVQAHYLSVLPLNNTQLINTTTVFLSKLLPSDSTQKKLLLQLQTTPIEALNKGIQFNENGEGHFIMMSTYSHQGATNLIHYRWIPPEH